MVTELLAALRAIPRIVDALERLGDVGTAMAAQRRKDEKDKVLEEIIAIARRRHDERVREREAERVSGDNSETPSGS